MNWKIAGLLVLLGSIFAEAGGNAFKLSNGEKALLEMTNAERKKQELPPLKADPLLFKVARAHAENMAKQSKMEHKLDGKDQFDRLREAGYRYGFAGENIAYGDPDITMAELMKGWMDSKPHRENILAKGYSEIGLGIARDDKGRIYYAQVFGRRR